MRLKIFGIYKNENYLKGRRFLYTIHFLPKKTYFICQGFFLVNNLTVRLEIPLICRKIV